MPLHHHGSNNNTVLTINSLKRVLPSDPWNYVFQSTLKRDFGTKFTLSSFTTANTLHNVTAYHGNTFSITLLQGGVIAATKTYTIPEEFYTSERLVEKINDLLDNDPVDGVLGPGSISFVFNNQTNQIQLLLNNNLSSYSSLTVDARGYLSSMLGIPITEEDSGIIGRGVFTLDISGGNFPYNTELPQSADDSYPYGNILLSIAELVGTQMGVENNIATFSIPVFNNRSSSIAYTKETGTGNNVVGAIPNVTKIDQFNVRLTDEFGRPLEEASDHKFSILIEYDYY